MISLETYLQIFPKISKHISKHLHISQTHIREHNSHHGNTSCLFSGCVRSADLRPSCEVRGGGHLWWHPLQPPPVPARTFQPSPSLPFRAGVHLGFLAHFGFFFYWYPTCQLGVEGGHLQQEAQIQVLESNMDPVGWAEQAKVIIRQIIRGLVQLPGPPTQTEEASTSVHIKRNLHMHET